MYVVGIIIVATTLLAIILARLYPTPIPALSSRPRGAAHSATLASLAPAPNSASCTSWRGRGMSTIAYARYAPCSAPTGLIKRRTSNKRDKLAERTVLCKRKYIIENAFGSAGNIGQTHSGREVDREAGRRAEKRSVCAAAVVQESLASYQA